MLGTTHSTDSTRVIIVYIILLPTCQGLGLRRFLAAVDADFRVLDLVCVVFDSGQGYLQILRLSGIQGLSVLPERPGYL